MIKDTTPPPQPPANQPLNLVRGKPTLIQLPSPQLADKVFKLRKDPRKGDYVLPNPGDPYEGPYKELLQNFFFATAKPTEDNQRDHFYLNERTNQDEYNYTITFPYADKNFPLITRTYVVLRTDSLAIDEPQADTKDPVFPELSLTDHKIIRLDDPIFDAVFVSIQRTFEKLPSPVITSYGTNKYLQKTVIRAQEVISSPPPTLSALIEQATQERTGTAKAKNTTATVDSVFPADVYKEELPNFFREEFQAAFTTDMHTQRLAGQAVPPTLTAGEFMVQDSQENEFVHVIQKEVQQLPQSRHSKELGAREFGAGILANDTTVDTPTSDLDIDSGYLVVDSQLRDLGPFGKIRFTHKLEQLSDPLVEVLSGGYGYDNTTMISFIGGVGSGAAATPIIGYGIASVIIDNGGTHYQYPPFAAAIGDGYGFLATVQLTAGVVTGVTILSGGYEFTSPPQIIFVGGNGGGALAHCTLQSTGAVKAVSLDNPGSYTVAPSVVFSTGTGAAAIHHIPTLDWPWLYESETDPHYGIVVFMLKKTVPAPAGYPGTGYVDTKAYDRWRSIQITSKVDLATLPPPIVWATTHEYPFPDTLLAIEAVIDHAGGSAASADMTSFTSGIPGAENPSSSTLSIQQGGNNVSQTSSVLKGGIGSVSTTLSDAVFGDISVQIQHGYRGPALAQITRIFFYGPPPPQFLQITPIFPVTGVATFIGKSVTFRQTMANNNLSGSNEGQMKVSTKEIGPVLTGNVSSFTQTFDGISTTVSAFVDGTLDSATYPILNNSGPYGINGTLSVNIPVSFPTRLSPGQWLTIAAPVEEWRFGIFVMHILRVQVP